MGSDKFNRYRIDKYNLFYSVYSAEQDQWNQLVPTVVEEVVLAVALMQFVLSGFLVIRYFDLSASVASVAAKKTKSSAAEPAERGFSLQVSPETISLPGMACVVDLDHIFCEIIDGQTFPAIPGLLKEECLRRTPARSG